MERKTIYTRKNTRAIAEGGRCILLCRRYCFRTFRKTSTATGDDGRDSIAEGGTRTQSSQTHRGLDVIATGIYGRLATTQHTRRCGLHVSGFTLSGNVARRVRTCTVCQNAISSASRCVACTYTNRMSVRAQPPSSPRRVADATRPLVDTAQITLLLSRRCTFTVDKRTEYASRARFGNNENQQTSTRNVCVCTCII